MPNKAPHWFLSLWIWIRNWSNFWMNNQDSFRLSSFFENRKREKCNDWWGSSHPLLVTLIFFQRSNFFNDLAFSRSKNFVAHKMNRQQSFINQEKWVKDKCNWRWTWLISICFWGQLDKLTHSKKKGNSLHWD